MSSNSNSKTRYNPFTDDHPEKLKNPSSSSSNFAGGFKQQLKGLVNPDSWMDQIFNKPHTSESFPRKPYQERPLRKQETLVFSRQSCDQEKAIQMETHELLNQLKKQITLLEKSEKGLVSEISKIKVEKLPPKTGVYHLRFLEWLIILVKQLRMKVEEGQTWLSTFSQRKKKKIGYWQMYKKHGTTFGLSYERSLATQTG